MRILSGVIIAVMCLMLCVPLVMAGSEQNTQAQIEALQAQIESLQEQNQKQIEALQVQLNDLQGQVVAQRELTKEKDIQISKLEDQVKPWFEKGFKSGNFKLRDAMGLDDESKLNIGGEIVMRYRQNQSSDAGDPGFQFYETELFLDAALHKYLSAYIEYDLIHENHAQAEDVWIDLHTDKGPLAFAGGTGMKIGNFHYPFGWDNDDEEGYVYGGRTSVNTSLIRGQRIDGWRLRERQVGLAGYYNFDPTRDLNISATAGVFNGTGDVNHYSGKDVDQAKDFATRVEAKYKDAVVGVSYLFAPYTRNVTANTNDTAHYRDIRRYGLHFKYPDVPFPGQDISLGGKPWLIWGEFVWGDNDANPNVAAANVSQHVQGGYIELDAALKKDTLLGFLRYDYYEPNTNTSADHTFGITPGVRWNIFNSSYLVAEYEIYGGAKNASNSIKKEDRVALQLTTQF
ncbi:MAG: FlxA-like family protein [Candidatus Omnitrophota bacterium]